MVVNMEQISHERIDPTMPSLKIHVFTSKVPGRHRASSLHIHREIEIMYIFSGSVEWAFNNEKFVAYAGDCVFVNYFIPHSTFCLEDTDYIILQLPIDNLFESGTSINSHLYNFIVGSNNPYSLFKKDSELCQSIADDINGLAENYDLTAYYNKLVAYACSINIVAQLIKDGLIEENYFGDSLNPNIKKILPIADYVEENFASGISLDTLSHHCGFNNVYLCRIFKQATGKTIVDYINYVKVQNCLEKLKDPSLSITQVATSCGFSNISHFNTTFKKQIGCSPSSYRKSKL